jgi:hypothetical protein
MRNFTRIFLAAALIASVAAFALPLPALAAGGGTVEPSVGRPKAVLTFTATGYKPGEHLAAWVNLPDASVRAAPGQVFADAAGTMVWQWKVPDDAVSGEWRMVGRGESSLYEAVIPVTIEGAAPPAPAPAPAPAGVSPESGAPGSTFTFTASGFGREEEISYWATQPNGAVVVNNLKVKSSRDGRVTFNWDAPRNAIAGRWVMTIFSRATQRTQQIAFTIVASAATTPSGDGVTPPSGQPGTTFSFSASGFGPNAELRRWVTAPDGSTSADGGRFNADRDGRVSFAWESPANALPGAWLMVVQSLDNQVARQLRFTIEARPGVASEGVSPAEATPGTTLTFYVTGVPAGMLLDYFATDPQGRGEPVPQQVQADSTGRAEWQWTIPADGLRGRWAMSVRRAQGDRSGGAYVQRQIFFTVR